MATKIKIILIIMVLFFASVAGAQMNDLETVHTETKEIIDQDGSVKIRVDWLKSPGEMMLTITYNGFLTQEGLANFYLKINGEQREFMTMRQEMKNRAQRIKIISFHPTKRDKKINRLVQLPADTIVDKLLFKNAPYYKQFGTLDIEIIFFCHGRWDGDGNNNNENYRFSFVSDITDFSVDHF